MSKLNRLVPTTTLDQLRIVDGFLFEQSANAESGLAKCPTFALYEDEDGRLYSEDGVQIFKEV